MVPTQIDGGTIAFLTGLAVNLFTVIRISNALEHRITALETKVEIALELKKKTS